MLAMRILSEAGDGPNMSLAGLLFAGIAFFLLIIVVGWLTSVRKQDNAEGTHEVKNSGK